MRAPRQIVVFLFAGLIAAGLVVDNPSVVDRFELWPIPQREFDEVAQSPRYSSPVSTGASATWYCTGGTKSGGTESGDQAMVSLEITNASSSQVTARVLGIRNGEGVEPSEREYVVGARATEIVQLEDLVEESDWMGAVVGVDSGDVLVEQLFTGRAGASDRALCHTQTSSYWSVANGSTSRSEEGERLVLLFLNPFSHDAVVNIRLNSSAGVETLEGIVVPALRLVALDVVEEAPDAEDISMTMDVVVGRLAVSRLQSLGGISSDAESGEAGLAITPASASWAAAWHFLGLDYVGRGDLLSVHNPSLDETVQVAIEINGEGGLQRAPVQMILSPGASSEICLSDEARLSGLGRYAATVRSLSGSPIAAFHESLFVQPGGESAEVPSRCAVPTQGTFSTAGNSGIDVESRRWLTRLERNPQTSDSRTDLFNHTTSIFNPSPESIARVQLWELTNLDSMLSAEFEIQPLGLFSVADDVFVGEPQILEVVSSTPVVVSRDLKGESQHSLVPALATAPLAR